MDDFTPVKKMMTERMYTLYCAENHGGGSLCGACESSLRKAYRHLDACKFKDKGWPCPTCPECCFKGADFEELMTIMGFAEQWMKDNPERAAEMQPPTPPVAG